MDSPQGGSPFCHALLGQLPSVGSARIRGMLYSFEETPGGVREAWLPGSAKEVERAGHQADISGV